MLDLNEADGRVKLGRERRLADTSPTQTSRTPVQRRHLDADLAHAAKPLLRLVPELLLALAGAVTYFAVRGLMSGSEGDAVENARMLVRFEKMLWFYWEPAWQETLSHHALVTLANWIYIYGHWPFIACVGIWLMRYRHATYVVFRDAFFISGFVGLLIFVLFPVAPPRLAGLEFVDTITRYSNSYRVLQPPAFVNQYAAFPSLHFGWNLLVGLAVFRTVSNRLIQVAALAVPTLMFFAVVATANHFIIDAVAGGALSLLALMLAERIAGRSVVRPAPPG